MIFAERFSPPTLKGLSRTGCRRELGAGFTFGRSALIGFQPVAEGPNKLGVLYVESDLNAMYSRMELYGLILAARRRALPIARLSDIASTAVPIAAAHSCAGGDHPGGSGAARLHGARGAHRRLRIRPIHRHLQSDADADSGVRGQAAGAGQAA